MRIRDFFRRKSAAQPDDGSIVQRALPYIKPKVTGNVGRETTTRGYTDSPVLRDLGNGLLVAYVADIGQTLQYVQKQHLAAAGITEGELHRTAMLNFAEFTSGRVRVERHSNIFAIHLDGNFEAGLLLVDKLWDGWREEFGLSHLIVAVPARDVIAFADGASTAGISELRGLVARVFPKGDHLISRALYQRESKSWVRLDG